MTPDQFNNLMFILAGLSIEMAIMTILIILSIWSKK